MDNETIEAWLDSLGKDRHWLASEMGISKGTLDNGFSKGFTARAKKQIQDLMNPPDAMELEFTDRQFDLITEAMKIGAYTARKDFYKDAIIDRARQITEADARSKIIDGKTHFDASSKVAEDTPPYGKQNGA